MSLKTVIYWFIFQSLDQVVDKLYDNFSNTVNLHCSDHWKKQVFSHILHLSVDFHSKKDWSVILIALSKGDEILRFCREAAVEAIPKALDLILGVRYLLRIFGPKGAFSSLIFFTSYSE